MESDSGQKLLVAYLVEKPDAPTQDTLKSLLAEKLPGYMVPQLYMSLDTLPLLPNDKLDRSQLPGLAEVRRATQTRQKVQTAPLEPDLFPETLLLIQQAVAALRGDRSGANQ